MYIVHVHVTVQVYTQLLVLLMYIHVHVHVHLLWLASFNTGQATFETTCTCIYYSLKLVKL